MALKGKVVGHAVAQRAAARRRTVVKIINAVVTAQAAESDCAIGDAALQHVARDIERQRGADLASQRVGGDQHRIPRPVDVGQIGQGKGAGLQLGGSGPVAVNKDVDRRRHRRFAGKRRQRPGDQIRAQREVAPVADPAHPHAAAPVQRVGDDVPQLPLGGIILIGEQQRSVVAGITLVLPGGAGEVLPQRAGGGEHRVAVEIAKLMPKGSLATCMLGAAGIDIVV